MTAVTDADGLAARVDPGSTVAIGGALFSRLPIGLIRRVAARRVSGLHYVAWGGGLPLEMFLDADMISRLSFCFSSLDVFGMAPRFRAALEAGAIDATEWTALGMIQALQAAGQNLPSASLQEPAGSDLRPHLTATDPASGETVALARRMDIDTLLLHAQRADTDGNIEIQGVRGLDLSLIPAARQVLVTVEELVPCGSLGAARSVIISRHLVSAIAVMPDGAFPSSCLPYYAASYRAIRELAEDPLRPTPAAEYLDRARSAARITPQAVEAALAARPAAEPGQVSTAELMMAWLAARYEPGSTCSAGAVSPLALGSYLLAKELTDPGPSIITTSGGYWDIGPRPLLLGLGEVLDFASAPLHMGGDETYHQLYQSGRIDYEVINVAQVDARAATNNLWVTSPSGRTIRLPGQGGMADVADMHANFVLYQTRQSPLSLVEQVTQVSARRVLHATADREASGYRPGNTALITNLAVFEPDEATGRLRPVSLHPGVSAAQLRAATGFAVDADGLPVTAAPEAAALDLLRGRIDPLGLRDLEFVAARDRTAVIQRVLAAEEQLIDEVTDGPAPAPTKAQRSERG